MMAGMASRSERAELGIREARRLALVAGDEIREARLLAGVSQAAAARAAGLSAAQWGRLERGDIERPHLVQLCCAGRALGLKGSWKFYPVASPLRDAPQLALLGRFEHLLGAPLLMGREVGLPIVGDLRAWDGMVDGDGDPFFVEGESHVNDAQAVERRLRLKQRDDPRASTVILVLTRSDHNRRVMEAHREVFRDLLPLDTTAVLRAVRMGRRPPASGIVLV